MRQITVQLEDADGLSLAVRSYLKRYHHVSTSLWKRIKFSGTFKVNGVSRIAARTMVKTGDVITYDVTRTSDIPPEPMRLDIRYEDDFLLIINKPAGLLVHPTTKMFHGTLAGGVLYHYAERGERHDYHPVHRLDMDTSGLVLIAKEPEVQNLLFGRTTATPSKHFSREYLAIVRGRLTPPAGLIDAPIARALPSIILRIVSSSGKPARTHYETLAYDGTFSLLRLRLETGRTHQIRVHLAHLGHPLVGDSLYGGDTAILPRQALHACHISLRHPITGLRLSIHAPLPSDMASLLLRNHSCSS